MDTMPLDMTEALRRDVERCESEFLDQSKRAPSELAEAERIAADLYWITHRDFIEARRQDRALMQQQQALSAQGLL